MKDHRILQRSKAKQEGRELLEADISFEKFRTSTKQWPAGSIHLWSTEEVYGPMRKKEKAA